MQNADSFASTCSTRIFHSIFSFLYLPFSLLQTTECSLRNATLSVLSQHSTNPTQSRVHWKLLEAIKNQHNSVEIKEFYLQAPRAQRKTRSTYLHYIFYIIDVIYTSSSEQPEQAVAVPRCCRWVAPPARRGAAAPPAPSAAPDPARLRVLLCILADLRALAGKIFRV